MKAQGKDDFDEAIVVNEKTVTDKQMKKSVKIKAYLMQIYNQDIYKLIVESNLEDITNQTMNGTMDFNTAFPKKLELIRPSHEDLDKL